MPCLLRGGIGELVKWLAAKDRSKRKREEQGERGSENRERKGAGVFPFLE